ncbi:retrotransposon protein, putative, ty1-copia subclass, partial [Tanacetum coccineum]
SPSTSIEKKTPMEMWSGHPSDYGMLRIFSCVAYPHDKQGDKSVEELQVEVELQRLNNHTLEEDQKDQEDGDDEDAGDQETNQPPDLTDYQLVWNREPRTRTKPLRFRDESNIAAYAFVAVEEDTHEPLTYQEAVACEDSSKWKATMKEEMDSLRKNKTWELVDHPVGQKLVSCKWLFKIKEGTEVRHTSIRVILALTAYKDYELEQLDVKTIFLHRNLKDVIYMRQPPGFEQGNKVCLLKKSLYGLKQSPRQWYRRFDEYMLNNGFKRSSYDSCVYYMSYAPGEYIYLLLYVDDMLIACKSKAEIGSTKSLLKKEFDIKELGEAKKILGMEIVRDQSRKILRVSQSGYVSKILNNFRIDKGKSVKMPLGGHFKLSLKDCLLGCYVIRAEDIAVCGLSVSSKILANPGFVDSDYAKDPDKGRSITGYIFLVRGCVVSWKHATKHVGWLFLTIEAEYMALTEAVKEAILLRGLLEVFGKANDGLKVMRWGTEHNVADALTKAIPGLKLQYCLELLNIHHTQHVLIIGMSQKQTNSLRREPELNCASLVLVIEGTLFLDSFVVVGWLGSFLGALVLGCWEQMEQCCCFIGFLDIGMVDSCWMFVDGFVGLDGSGLPPFQYQLTRTEKVDRNACNLREK